ncbi:MULTISPECIES: NADH-dependent [FeFe] hydrogenase, group A6 [unclassified Romboutsia]|uniref:NADH-dependent [FeFe] hydrogenase, group A6 n=1 Tax=unclassified Romboutsia TaxID=2626894 RepID=UPI0008228B51|nr:MULTISPECIES: NADH-dependent [FeFe] hydrogenase, group A6 [unclassified Romboutsia]SCI22520.1 Iron hydrogenase 1 [uncultured Clostridium sp.]
MSLVNLTINGKEVSVPSGTKILEAAKQVNINIPNLCHLKMDEINMVNQCASCRVCMVSAGKKLVPACGTNVKEGMVVNTNTPEALRFRKNVVELLLSDHPQDCLSCSKNGKCELQDIAAELGIRKIRFKGEQSSSQTDTSSKSIVKDNDKCILCRRCETMCNEVQTVGVLSGVNRGFNTEVGTFFDADLVDTECTYCGQCISVCPTGALMEKDNTTEVWNALGQKEKPVMVQIAPAVRVGISEEFGLDAGSISTGKLVSALKLLGFDYVFDTNFAADLTIMEEGTEFIGRLQSGQNLPILTSCCPAWVNFVELQYPDLINHLSTCRSPQGMFSPIARYYFANKVLNKKPDEVTIVSIMPCVAKKYEISREELGQDEILDTDISITVRELARMIKEAGIDLTNLEESEFDSPLGYSTGAADIFGVTGGVLEAALRTAYEVITKETLENIDFTAVRGMEGIKEASIDINGTTVNVAAASSLGNARVLMDELRAGKSKYHIIEIMACPGGCVAGGGQPFHGGDYAKIKARGAGLYQIDANKPLRKSHENPDIQKLYADFLGEPNGHTAHKYLHTHYFDRSNVYGEYVQEAELATEGAE